MTSKYNGYFNAREILKEEDILLEQRKENFEKILPVFKFPLIEDSTIMKSKMVKVLEKCKKVISKHSVEEKGKEQIKWIDDNYLIIGIANFYSRNFAEAKNMFKFISRKFRHHKTHHEALLWTSKVYLEEKNYAGSERILRLIKGKKKFPESLKKDLNKTYASLYIKKEDYDKAIKYLKKSISLENKKPKRARLILILAQVYIEKGNYNYAINNLDKVIDLNTNYDMVFYSKLKKSSLISKSGSAKEKTKKTLIKLLKDEKNKEFRDQIYYALGELELLDNELMAVEYYKKSVATSVSNQNQKGLSFLRLSKINYKNLKYKQSKVYYDSTVQFLKPTHKDFNHSKMMSENLTALIEQIEIINYQDSTQKTAKMPKNKLLAYIEEFIFQKELEKETQAEETGNTTPINEPKKGIMPSVRNLIKREWYFYNPKTVAIGKSDFINKWGGRKNEDNWRRSQKILNINNFNEEKKQKEDWQTIDFYLKKLPLTKEKINISNDILVDAYYKLGLIYQEKIENDNKAIETFEEMNKRFENHKYLVEVYYRLFGMYNKNEDIQNANKYKVLILRDFPNSKYSQILKDPGKVKNIDQKEKNAMKFYNEVYINYYKRGFYSQTIYSIDKNKNKYIGTKIEPKVMFIKAMSIGNKEGKAKMVEELKLVKAKFNNNAIAKKVDEVLSILNQKLNKKKAKIKKEDIYKEDKNEKEYYYILIFPNKSVNLNQVKVALSNFNRSRIKNKKIIITEKIQNDTCKIKIDGIKSLRDAKNYATKFKNEKFKLVYVKSLKLISFFISIKNLAKLNERKNNEEYLEYYKKSINYKYLYCTL